MSDWLPVGDLYLERADAPDVRPERPWNQSDVFTDVPISIVNRFRPGTGPEQPAPTRRVTVMLLSHPCVMRAGRAGNPSDHQVVAEVQPVDEAQGGRPFRAPWDSHFSLFPLPGLLGGTDYAVNFRRIGVTHRGYLQGHRVAVLSHWGWAAMQRRYAYHSLRLDLDLASRRLETAAPWEEIQLWEEWNTRGHDPGSFQPWLSEPLSAGRRYAGEIRRSTLEYAPDDVRADLPAPR